MKSEKLKKIIDPYYPLIKSSKNKIETFQINFVIYFAYIPRRLFLLKKNPKNPFRGKQKVIPLIELFTLYLGHGFPKQAGIP